MFVVFAILLSWPVLAEESPVYIRHFEIPMPRKEAPKPIAVVLPEERSPREMDVAKLLLPIEPDPSTEIKPDLVE